MITHLLGRIMIQTLTQGIQTIHTRLNDTGLLLLRL